MFFKYHKTILLTYFLSNVVSFQISAGPISIQKDDNAILQVKSTVQYPNFLQPWRFKNPETRRSYGIYVGDGLILTPSQTVNYTTGIEITKTGSLKTFTAKVIKSDPDLSLALLKVEDKSFPNGLTSVQFPTDIFLPSQGLLLEYKEFRNLGEKKVRTIKLEMDTYANGYIELPIVEIQSDEKFEGIGELIVEETSRIPQGIVISFKDSQNVGRMIPSFMIKSFLESKCRENCIPFKGFRFRTLTDRATRDYYGVKKDDQGVVIAEVYPTKPNNGTNKLIAQLQLEDVLLEVAGFKIDPKGYFEHPKYGKIGLSFLFHTNEEFTKNQSLTIPIKILRNKKLIEFDYSLSVLDENAIKIPFGNTRGRKPTYLILGGIVFQELSEHYLMEYGPKWRARVSKYLLYLNDFFHITSHYSHSPNRFVVLTQVLPLTGNQAYHSMHQNVLEKVNGNSILNLSQLNEVIKSNKEEFLVFDFQDGSQVIFKSEEITKLNQEALKTFKIPAEQNF